MLDSRWIGEYERISSFPNLIDSKLRAPELEGQKAAFIASGFETNPDLRPEIDLDRVQQSENDVRNLQDKIIEEEQEEVVVDAYVPRLEELLGNLTMLRAAHTYDGDTFMAANANAFKRPNPRTFSRISSFFRGWAANYTSDQSLAAKGAALVVLDTVPEPLFEETDWFTEEEFRKLQVVYSPLYEALDEFDIPEDISGANALALAQQVLDRADFGYRAIPQKSGLSTMSVNHVSREMKIPQTELYTAARFKGLLAHEGLIHIAERIEGGKQPLRLTYSGLKQYLRAGEGKGVLAEQGVYGSFEEFKATKRFFDIARRHFAIGLALGMDGNGARDFKEVFAIINAIDNLFALVEQPDNEQMASPRAVNRTWELLAMRTQKGVVGRGMAALKDGVYAEGLTEQGKLLIGNPSIFPYLNLGKYNLANPVHVSILERAGIIPVGIVSKARQ
jgi:hypothetical protein